LAACKDTNSQSGVLTATLNVLEMEASNRPQIITISYGECEPNLGPTVHAAFRAAFQIAALEGVSVYLAQGDYLSDACDGKAGQHYATHGLSVSGYATTGYNVSVGGTDFEDVYLGTTGSYWIDASSGAAAVAQSYIPEIPWNGSCANPLLARHLNYGGVNALCNTGQYVDLSGGGGGPSACALGHASISGEVSGTCRGEPRPTWQRGVVGLPENDVRMVPDISMFASEGTPWDHRLVFCNQGVCGPGGGTSFASPIMAGVQALVNQKMNATAGLGLVSPIYYALAKRELDGPNRSVMCAPLSILPGSTCVFHNVRTGGNAGPCASGTPKCFSEATGQHLGVLSRSTIEFEPAFAAHPGWNPATGLGSVDVTNLLIAWGTVAP
jgi:subtilase family serine protease